MPTHPINMSRKWKVVLQHRGSKKWLFWRSWQGHRDIEEARAMARNYYEYLTFLFQGCRVGVTEVGAGNKLGDKVYVLKPQAQ